MTIPVHASSAASPLMLLVPGADDRASRRWAADWQHAFPDSALVDLGHWQKPHRNNWVNRLNLDIARAGRPVVLVAQGLACVVVSWWAAYEQPEAGGLVRGALLIDPPDVDRPGTDAGLAALTSCSRAPLPFPACMLVTNTRGSPVLRTLWQLARDWDCAFDTVATASGQALTAPGPVVRLGQHLLSGMLNAGR